MQSQADEPDSIKGARAAPESGVSEGSNNYWATDQCHYFYQDGAWYGDLCWAWQVEGVLMNFYRYPGPGQTPTDVVYQWQIDSQTMIVRFPALPLFQYVEWMAWPITEQPTASNVVYQLKGRTDWIRAADLNAWANQRSVTIDYPTLDRYTLAWSALGNYIGQRGWQKPNCIGLDEFEDPRCG